MTELSATFSTPKGHVIIAGCSHSTIETIIPEKMKVRKKKIYLVTVGFHLIPYNRKYTKGLAKRMQQEGIRYPKCGSSPHHRASRVFCFQTGRQVSETSISSLALAKRFCINAML